ncbi:MAG: MATE family efflux transporter [Armatimonadota bacterium]|nr:MATE family efflux transporter [Armatimonadota bacterium]
MTDEHLESTTPTDQQELLVTTITEGNVWRAVWFLSWPTMISMFLSTAYMWINRIFVGKGLGTEAIDAVGLGGQALMVIFSVVMGVTAGTTALVSRFTGARSQEEAEQSAKQSIILSIIVSLIITLPSLALAEPALRWMGAKGAVVPMAVSYTVICVLSTAPFFVLLVLAAIFRGLGDMKTPLYVTGLVTVVNIIADYLLIFGIGPFPKMGSDGAALAIGISRIAGVAASIYWLLRSPLKGSIFRPWTPHLGWFVRIMKIGGPAILQGLMFSLGFTGYLWILGKLDNSLEAQAAFFIGSGAEAIAYMPGFAFMMAATSLVGQNLGARRADRAEHGAWICAWQSLIVMTAMAAIFYIFADPFSRIFTKDAHVIPLSVSYLRINAISEPFFGFAMVFSGAMQGAGDTKTPTIIAFITMWLIRLPLTYVASIMYGGGITAAWIIMSGTTILRGIIMIIIFMRGKWKTVEV